MRHGAEVGRIIPPSSWPLLDIPGHSPGSGAAHPGLGLSTSISIAKTIPTDAHGLFGSKSPQVILGCAKLTIRSVMRPHQWTDWSSLSSDGGGAGRPSRNALLGESKACRGVWSLDCRKEQCWRRELEALQSRCSLKPWV
jgi:hypothetical protein